MEIDKIVKKIEANLNIDEVLDAAKRGLYDLDNPGFCIKCGFEQDGCEPDAREYRCENCGEHAVFGAEELIIYIV